MMPLSRLDVNGLVRSGVLFFPASLGYEKPSQLFVRLHPKHRIDLILLKHGIPSCLINLLLDQLEIVTQQRIRISGGRPAVDENRHAALGTENQQPTDIPMIQKPGVREMALKIECVLL